jgi:predicted metal-dependent phosphoesterase TrpH
MAAMDRPSTEPAFCDLHLHSTASDGTNAPADLPRLCKAAGLSAFALTDHDTTAGLAACAAAARQVKIDFVPGVELSANPDLDETGEPFGTLHVLGHFVDAEAPGLAAISERMTRARDTRNPRIVEKLRAAGVRVEYQEVLDLARELAGGAEGTMIGRPHIGQLLINKGYVRSMHEAFVKYLGSGGVAHTRRDRLAAAEAIEAIHEAGGLATLAHPVQLERDPDDLEHAVARLVDLGLDGIEVYHSDHTPADVQRFTKLARRFNLLPSGGSDYHGSRKAVALNGQRVPRAVYEGLREKVSGVGGVR